MKTLGKVIEKGRISKGLTLEEAAKRANISRMTLSRLEKNQTENIKIENLINISNFLEIDFLEMIKGWELQIYVVEIESILKLCRIINYKGRKIDITKLEELINQNLDKIAE